MTEIELRVARLETQLEQIGNGRQIARLEEGLRALQGDVEDLRREIQELRRVIWMSAGSLGIVVSLLMALTQILLRR
jgi:TolA-binding protein